MRTLKLLYFKESRVDTILRKRLEKEGYRIDAKVGLSDAINKDKGEFLAKREFDYLTRAHLDFLITKDNWPQFAVEFDGPHHQQDKKAIENDVLKNRLCRSAGLPLLRIRADQLDDLDQTTALDYMLDRYVAWGKEKDELLAMVEEFAENIPENASPEDLAVDLDPHFWFDVRHPFPGIAKVGERLWRKHRVASVMKSPAMYRDAQYLCYAGMRSAGQFEDDEFITFKAGASIWQADRYDPSGPVWQTGQSKDDSLFSATASASVRAWLPTERDIPQPTDLGTLLETAVTSSDYDRLGKQFLDQFERRVEAIWQPKLPGIEPWDIAENLSEYLALRKIEKWAAENLDE